MPYYKENKQNTQQSRLTTEQSQIDGSRKREEQVRGLLNMM